MTEVSTLSPDKVMEEALASSKRLVEDLKILLIYQDLITGKGLEFERLREYSPGDEARMIDWNSLASTQKLYTRIFKEERMLDVVFVVDVSTTMTLGTTELLKNEYAAILAATLSKTALDAGDEVGLISFADNLRETFEPSYTDESPYHIAEKLCKEEIYGGKANWGMLRETFQADDETFIFVISDFMNDTDEMYDFLLQSVNRFNGVFCIMVRDPLDSHLPEGVGRAYLSDPMTGEVNLVDVDEVREEYNRKAAEQEARVQRKIEAAGGHFFKIHTDENFVDRFAKYLDQRARLWK